jgi:guanosine-3',5'-bis(diphosphate) 3'-pyrophosphohydrolase
MKIIELFEDVKQALDYATQAHAGQTRSGGEPYIGHPVRVANTIRQYKQSHNIDALIAAAYLHDTIEDTDATHEALHDLFGGLVASLVLELTSDLEQIKKVGKKDYLAKKMAHDMSSYGLVIKLADRLDNVQDIATAKSPAWRAKYKAETEHIMDYLEQNRVLSGTHKKLIGLIRSKLEQIPVDTPVV